VPLCFFPFLFSRISGVLEEIVQMKMNKIEEMGSILRKKHRGY